MPREQDLVFAGAAADPHKVAQAVATHGVALLRGVLPKARVGALHREAESYFRHLAARMKKGESDNATELFRQYCNVTITSTQEAGYAGLFDVFALIGESALVPCLESALGGEPFVPFQYCLVRRVLATQIREAALFHQDISPIGPDVPITCWVPLSECGVNAPGLEFVARPLSHRLPPSTRSDSHHPGAEIDEQVVVGDFGPDLWHPELGPGDVLMFNNLTIHRSYLSAGMAKPRCSIEFRVLSSAAAPERLAGVQGVVFRRTPLAS